VRESRRRSLGSREVAVAVVACGTRLRSLSLAFAARHPLRALAIAAPDAKACPCAKRAFAAIPPTGRRANGYGLRWISRNADANCLCKTYHIRNSSPPIAEQIRFSLWGRVTAAAGRWRTWREL